MHRTGFTGLICSSPSRESPATPNRVWKGSTCRGEAGDVLNSRDPFNDNQGFDDTAHWAHGFEDAAMSQSQVLGTVDD